MNIKINNKIIISPSTKPLIVAEISGNHNGSKKSFLKHIVAAAKNGADLVKIQTYEPDDIVIKKAALDPDRNAKAITIIVGIYFHFELLVII